VFRATRQQQFARFVYLMSHFECLFGSDCIEIFAMRIGYFCRKPKRRLCLFVVSSFYGLLSLVSIFISFELTSVGVRIATFTHLLHVLLASVMS